LVEIRTACWAGRSQQGADLAEALHNLPTDMWQDNFRLDIFRSDLERYQDKKYPGFHDYLAELDEIEELGGGTPDAGLNE